jgi:transposase
VTQEELIKAEVPVEKFDLLSREELIEFIKLEQKYRIKLQSELKRLRTLNEELKQKSMLIEDKYVVIKNKFFGKSSEKEPKQNADNAGSSANNKEKKKRALLPSERYPEAPLIERDITLQDMPACSCCGSEMVDSGMTEDSEFLTVIPQQYLVVRQKRRKYRCKSCYGALVTAPAPPRIKEGSAYSDEMMIDVAMTKYCDLIPIDRYAAIAGREGLEDLPQQSLIETTHYVADTSRPAYGLLKTELTSEEVFNADETPHRMLEGDDKSNWHLWGFSTEKTSYFEYHDTRSGDVASDILINSKCRYLVSDVFSGYAKAVRDANEIRQSQGLPTIRNVYCNAHSRRKFKEARDIFPDEAQFFIDQYKEIYRLNTETKGRPPDEIIKFRQQMAPLFEAIKARAMECFAGYPSKSSIGKAISYFLKNFDELTLFLKNAALPIDNNQQERLLRNPVIGRKTWYGTHSKRGAETAAILFSLVESCKLNNVNPRIYFKCLIQDIHAGLPPFTPATFAATYPVKTG